MTQDLQFALKVFDALPLYWILFDRDGTVITANRAFLDTLGLQKEEIRGMSPEELEIYYIDFRKYLAALEMHDSCTFRGRLLGKNGIGFPVEHTLAHVLDGEREVIVSISRRGEGRTVTEERFEAEKEIEKANQKKRQFIANINHEIRTPMNAIVGYAEMLAELSLDEQQRRYVEIIRKNSAHLINIVNDIVELSKLETGRVRLLKSTVNLRVIIKEIHELFADQAKGKHLEFNYQIDPGLPEYYILDAEHCRQILGNLVSNAVKYTDTGKITLSVTGVKKRAAWYAITFRITDTGRGMTVQEQKNILELIAQQEEAVTIHDGKCLGLTLSASLARIMGGEISLESVKGKGSSFSFTLLTAVADKERTPDQQEKQPQRQQVKRKKHPVILVVDDMPEMSHLVKIYFTGTAIRVLEATTREKCLEHAFQQCPDLILMDLNLAGSDGREITQCLRNDRRTEQIPVIAMTGMMMENNSLQPLFDDFLAKPFHLRDLRRIVDKYIQVTPDTVSVTDGGEAVPDPDQIALFWNEELDELYRETEMSGSLDLASELGEMMQEQGQQVQSLALLKMGEKIQQAALDLDIQGVDHCLAVLETIAKGKQDETSTR